MKRTKRTFRSRMIRRMITKPLPNRFKRKKEKKISKAHGKAFSKLHPVRTAKHKKRKYWHSGSALRKSILKISTFLDIPLRGGVSSREKETGGEISRLPAAHATESNDNFDDTLNEKGVEKVRSGSLFKLQLPRVNLAWNASKGCCNFHEFPSSLSLSLSLSLSDCNEKLSTITRSTNHVLDET